MEYRSDIMEYRLNIMKYRLGQLEDLDEICSLVQRAIAEMERQGIHQWDEIYPTRSDFENDIRKESLYLAFKEDTLVAFYVISCECDEQYQRGHWRYDEIPSPRNCTSTTDMYPVDRPSGGRVPLI